MISKIFLYCISGADLVDGVDALPPQGFDPLPTQRVSLCADPTSFVEALLAPLDTNFEVGALVKKRDAIFGKIFPKNAYNAFFGLFFNFFPQCKEIDQNRVFFVLWESSENQFGRPKKSSTEFSIFFKSENPTFFENIRSATAA